MANYYAITFFQEKPRQINAGRSITVPSWFVVAGPASDRATVEAKARESIGPARRPGDAYSDIYRETKHANLVVVPASKLRAYGIRDK